MASIPPIAKPGSNVSGHDEDTETEGQEQAEPDSEQKQEGECVVIHCAAKDCKYNKLGLCSKDEIEISAGPEVKCMDYEPGSKPPAPPVPPEHSPFGGGSSRANVPPTPAGLSMKNVSVPGTMAGIQGF